MNADKTKSRFILFLSAFIRVHRRPTCFGDESSASGPPSGDISAQADHCDPGCSALTAAEPGAALHSRSQGAREARDEKIGAGIQRHRNRAQYEKLLCDVPL